MMTLLGEHAETGPRSQLERNWVRIQSNQPPAGNGLAIAVAFEIVAMGLDELAEPQPTQLEQGGRPRFGDACGQPRDRMQRGADDLAVRRLSENILSRRADNRQVANRRIDRRQIERGEKLRSDTSG